jgi:CMP-N,N'-diacetyllegionaminic acid synthase
MRILALIAARGGSKRLPRKNCRLLGGKPLVSWSINVVKGIPEICDLIVSTDDNEIASICSAAGACVPWLRPAELATDTASSAEVALHALKWYEAERGEVDGLLLLQPTSPFRTRETILKGIGLYINNGNRSVLAVSPSNASPIPTFKIEGQYLKSFFDDKQLAVLSQDEQKTYTPNGSFYLISPSLLRDKKSFFSEQMSPLIIESKKEALDIDTEWDWFIAQSIVTSL